MRARRTGPRGEVPGVLAAPMVNRVLDRPALQRGPSGCRPGGVGGMREPRNHRPDPGLRGQGGVGGRTEAGHLGDRLCLSRWLTVPCYFCFLPPPQAGLCSHSLFFPQRTWLRPGGLAKWAGEGSQLWGQMQGSSTAPPPRRVCTGQTQCLHSLSSKLGTNLPRLSRSHCPPIRTQAASVTSSL